MIYAVTTTWRDCVWIPPYCSHYFILNPRVRALMLIVNFNFDFSLLNLLTSVTPPLQLFLPLLSVTAIYNYLCLLLNFYLPYCKFTCLYSGEREWWIEGGVFWEVLQCSCIFCWFFNLFALLYFLIYSHFYIFYIFFHKHCGQCALALRGFWC